MRKMKAPITEAQHQSTLIAWSQQPSIRQKYPDIKLLHHIPNGGSRNKIEAVNLKRQGVKAGVPDLHLPVPKGEHHGLYIEMKRADGGTLSPHQREWLKALDGQGYKVAVCHGWEEAREVLECYLRT